MTLEKTRLFGELGLEVAACETGHDLEQDSDVIFRLPRGAGALDPERTQILAHPRQRTLVKKAGQIVGGIGKQFAAAEADEEIEELLADGAVVVAAAAAAASSTCAMPRSEPSPFSVATRLSVSASGALPSSSDNRPYSAARS